MGGEGRWMMIMVLDPSVMDADCHPVIWGADPPTDSMPPRMDNFHIGNFVDMTIHMIVNRGLCRM